MEGRNRHFRFFEGDCCTQVRKPRKFRPLFFLLPRETGKGKQNGDIRPWPGMNEEAEEEREKEGNEGWRSFILCKACVHRLDLWSAASTTARLSS